MSLVIISFMGRGEHDVIYLFTLHVIVTNFFFFAFMGSNLLMRMVLWLYG